jgi:hypothetical protein
MGLNEFAGYVAVAASAFATGWIAARCGIRPQPPRPPNFARIVELNEAGELPNSDPADLEAGANRCAVR